MLIHELAKRSGLSSHTIRFYEKSGLIRGLRDEKVKTNKYLHYDEECLDRLLFIQEAKSVGFTIGEIGQMIDAWYGDRYTKEEKLSILRDKLAAIEARQKEIRGMKRRIVRFMQDIQDGLCDI